MNEPRTITLTPNFERIFKGMLAEAMAQAKASRMFDDIPEASVAEALRAVQRWLAPLTVAINAATSVPDIERVREVMTDILADIDKTAFAIENKIDEAAAADDGKGLL
jgi:hypothetical protein